MATGTWFAKAIGICAKDYVGVFRPLAPLLILIGDLDDWTPAEPCRRLAETAAAAGLPVEYQDLSRRAHHSFDSAAPVRFIAERINLNAASGAGRDDRRQSGGLGRRKDLRARILRALSETDALIRSFAAIPEDVTERVNA